MDDEKKMEWGCDCHCADETGSPVTPRVFSGLVFLVLMAALLSAAFAFCSASAEPLVCSVLSELPDYAWQKTASFPDWKNYTDDTLAMNSMISFQGYHGQGFLVLSVSEETESFTLYVNGEKADTVKTKDLVYVDISEAAKDGVNTVQISNILPLNLKNAVTVYIPYPEVLPGNGESGGIHPQALKLVEDLIESDAAWGFPGAQLAVVRNGREIYQNAWGKTNAYEPDGTPKTDSPAATPATLYDLASVTKMFTVNYAVQKLVTDGLLDINIPVVEILGDSFAADTMDFAYEEADPAPNQEQQIAWKRKITPRALLAHQAGFPADPQYFKPDYDQSKQSLGSPGANLLYATNREDTLKAIFRTPLMYEPGTQTKYSDVDYMVLGFIVERIIGERLDVYMKNTFYEPLGLTRTTYLPLENGFTADDCAATELNGNTRDRHVSFPGIREQTLQGEVHDEKAWYCMEGVSGHAGLFSCAADLTRLGSVQLTGGYGPHRFFSRNVLDLFTAPKSSDFGQWGLGWWREGDDQRPWYFGTQASPGTVGHQGWTGTLVMIDPSRQLVIAYLTNMINSPLTSADNLNRFDGHAFTASTLGFVPQILSIGIDEEGDISDQLMDLLEDMAAGSLKLIPEGADRNHPNVKNALSKLAVLRNWAAEYSRPRSLRFADELESKLPQESVNEEAA